MRTAVSQLKRISVWWIVCSACIVSAILVGASIPSRWNGKSDFIPLRNFTAEEFAYLLEEDAAWVIDISDSTVVIATQSFVRYYTSSRDGDGSGMQRDIARATFSDFYSEYQTDRGALEHALGRSLNQIDTQPDKIAGLTASFRASDVPLYILIEFLVLAGGLSFVAVACLRLPSRWLLPHPFTLLCIAYFWFLPQYAPALFDADFFHQRVILEQLFWPMGFLGVVSVACSIICGVIHLYISIRGLLRRYIFHPSLPPAN